MVNRNKNSIILSLATYIYILGLKNVNDHVLVKQYALLNSHLIFAIYNSLHQQRLSKRGDIACSTSLPELNKSCLQLMLQSIAKLREKC